MIKKNHAHYYRLPCEKFTTNEKVIDTVDQPFLVDGALKISGIIYGTTKYKK